MNHAARAALLVGAVLAWAVCRRAPAHRPIALALSLVLVSDTLRWMLTLPPRPALGLYVAVSGCSAWAGLHAFRCGSRGPIWLWGLLELWILFAPSPRSWWGIVPPVALALSILLQGAAALHFYYHRGPSSITQRVALALGAGDLAGLLAFNASLLELQAAVVALFIVGVQGAWLREASLSRTTWSIRATTASPR